MTVPSAFATLDVDDARGEVNRGQGGLLRILYLWDADYPWDVRTQKICSSLAAAGHDIHIVARNKRWDVGIDQLPEGTVHRMEPWRWLGRKLDAAASFPAFFSPRWRALVDGVVRSVRPHLVIVRDLPLCPLAISLGHRHGVPVILDMAENYSAMMQETRDAGRQKWFDFLLRNPKIVARVERYCLRRLDHVLTVVEESSDRIIGDDIGSAKVSVVSNTPPRDRVVISQARTFSTGALHVVYLGLMEIPRGVGDLLEAVGKLKERGTSVKLTLVGGGRDEWIFREQATRLGLNHVVSFRGYVPNRDALAIVATADIGIVPHHANDSWNTTIPNKLFDYMAAGLAVVSSDAAPCARVIRETGAGEVYRSRDTSDLANAIERLTDPAERRARGDAGQRAILRKYNWENDTQVLLSTVAEVVRAAAAGSR